MFTKLAVVLDSQSLQMPTKIHLLGEMHLDLQKYERCQRALQFYQPDVISLEVSRDYVKSRLKDSIKITKETVTSIPLEKGLSLSRQIRGMIAAAQDYKRENNGVKVIFSDESSDLDRRQLILTKSDWDDFLKASTETDKIIIQAFGKKILQEQQRSGVNLYDGITCLAYAVLLAQRENLLKTQRGLDLLYLQENTSLDRSRLERLIQRDHEAFQKIISSSGVIVHVGGITHFFGAYDNLYERIKKTKIPVTRASLLDFHENKPNYLTTLKKHMKI